jgi:hypothetical protein
MITEHFAPDVSPDPEGDSDCGDANAFLPLAGRRDDLKNKENLASKLIFRSS